MSDQPANLPPTAESGDYVVIARRYRPQTFDDLVGQEHVAKALSGAITGNRVGHAYLFTGARGVGKTSAARILAKALNCQEGPSPTPCNKCDICQSISGGNDIDVLEIDGASNRGIDEIRQLRQNVGVRPSRARLKIYIIDEVHMLTREAFNALLKTLEEPPEHVKFIFCTTEPSKIPVTILSRCQRFDFAGIDAVAIGRRLAQIAELESVSADPEAIELLARRATGSMRDAQSLFEQLLAFAPDKIALSDVHAMLGTADEERLGELAARFVAGDGRGALETMAAALGEGVEVAQLIEQLFVYLRDCMAAAVGCPAETLLCASAASRQQVVEYGQQLGLERILAAMQILDQTMSRLRFSNQARVLAELALMRICKLEDLDSLPALIAQLQSAGPVSSPGPAASSQGRTVRPPAAQKKTENPASAQSTPPPPDPSSPPSPTPDAGPVVELTQENAAEIWSQVLSKMSGLAADNAKHFDRIAISAPNRLAISFKPGYTFQKSICERPDQVARFEKVLAELTGRRIRVEFKLTEGEPAKDEHKPPVQAVSSHQRLRQASEHEMIRRAGELFGAEPTRVDGGPTG